MSIFIDRDEELAWLDKLWNSGKAELIIIYGRRRIGKTALVVEWMRRRKPRAIYFVAEEESEKSMLERLSRVMAEGLGDELLAERPFTTWRQVLTYLAREAERDRLGLIIDEFQYAVSATPGLPSTIQAIWDHRLSKTRAFLLLMGSAVSFTEGLMGGRRPLYGRATGVREIRPLSPEYVACFVPGWAPEDVVRLYGVFGAVPGYLASVDPRKGLWENVADLVLSPGARFLDEARHLLREELREVSRYFSVLEAIARGETTLGRIANRSGIPPNSLPKYIGVLTSMGVISKERPLMGAGRYRYVIADPFLRFWFRYVPSLRTGIETGAVEDVVEFVRKDFETSLAPMAWEEFLARTVHKVLSRRGVRYVPLRVGRWWHKGEEIDIVAEDTHGDVLVAEAKWSALGCSDVRREFSRLKAKASRAPFSDRVRYYVLGVASAHCPEPPLEPGEFLLTAADVAVCPQE